MGFNSGFKGLMIAMKGQLKGVIFLPATQIEVVTSRTNRKYFENQRTLVKLCIVHYFEQKMKRPH